MNCYCHEEGEKFLFCVENVENLQLEDVIQHKAWRKTDDKFLLSYPRSVFSNQHEKELISSNFSRLGQAMFESPLLGLEWERPLGILAQKFNENRIEWYIVGSVCDALRGINVKPFDVDIVVHTRDYYKAKDICYLNFPDSVIAPFSGSPDICPSEYFINPLKYFGRMFLAGALVEVAADEQWNLENREYEKISWNGHDLYVDSFQTRYRTEIARKRKERIKAFKKFLKTR